MDIPSLIIIAYFFLTLLVSFLCRRRNTELQRLLAPSGCSKTGNGLSAGKPPPHAAERKRV